MIKGIIENILYKHSINKKCYTICEILEKKLDQLIYGEKFIKYVIFKDCVVFQADVIDYIIGGKRIDINISIGIEKIKNSNLYEIADIVENEIMFRYKKLHDRI